MEHKRREGERRKEAAHALLESRREAYLRSAQRASLERLLGNGTGTADDVVEGLFFSEEGIVILPKKWKIKHFLRPDLLGKNTTGFSLEDLSLFKNERKPTAYTVFSMENFVDMYFNKVKDPTSALGVRRINGLVNFGGLKLFQEIFGDSKIVLPRHAFEDEKEKKYVPYLFFKKKLGIENLILMRLISIR